jgi:PadR family transcriptional regulator, regulatory protein PadR
VAVSARGTADSGDGQSGLATVPCDGPFRPGFKTSVQSLPQGLIAGICFASQNITMHSDKPDSGPELKKGSLELLVLTVLAQTPRHGYEIGRLIEQRSDGHLQFRISTLYPVLYRMEHRGWIKGRWVERPGERRRCYYQLTPNGRAQLNEERARWRAFAAAVNQVIEVDHA